MPATPIAASVSEDALYRKVARRIIPVLFVCYIAAYLDRVNVGFAKLQMQADVPQISDAVYGLGRRHFFPWLLYFRGSKQHSDGEGWRTLLDCAHHGELGNRLLLDDLREFPVDVLWASVVAWYCGGRFFSWSHSVSHLLVSVSAPRGNDRTFYVGGGVDRRHRCAVIGLDSSSSSAGRRD